MASSLWNLLPTATRFRLLKHTRLNVVALLNELPKTQHDSASFNVDVNTYTVRQYLIVSVAFSILSSVLLFMVVLFFKTLNFLFFRPRYCPLRSAACSKKLMVNLKTRSRPSLGSSSQFLQEFLGNSEVPRSPDLGFKNIL